MLASSWTFLLDHMVYPEVRVNKTSTIHTHSLFNKQATRVINYTVYHVIFNTTQDVTFDVIKPKNTKGNLFAQCSATYFTDSLYISIDINCSCVVSNAWFIVWKSFVINHSDLLTFVFKLLRIWTGTVHFSAKKKALWSISIQCTYFLQSMVVMYCILRVFQIESYIFNKLADIHVYNM